MVHSTKKPKVLIIGPDPMRARGGMSSLISNILSSEELNDHYDIAMWSSFIDGRMLGRALYSAERLASFCMHNPDYDLYHIHVCSGTSTWRKMRYVKRLGSNSRKVVLHVHGARYHTFFDECDERQKKSIRDLYESVGMVVLLSEEWRDLFADRKICNPEKIRVLPNGVNVPNGNATDYFSNNVLFLGRLGERKSPDVLIRAASEVISQESGAVFTFAGDGDAAPYEQLAAELGIASNCRFAGWTSGEKRRQLLKSSSIYCLPSKDEGLPMSVLEAMSYGLVAISTPVGGIPGLIKDGESGFLMEVGDYEGLSRLLLGLMRNPEQKKLVGERGRALVQDRFGMEAYAERLMEIYGEVVR